MEIDKLNQILKESEKNALVKDQVYWKDVWNQYVEETNGHYNVLSTKEAIVRLISEKNYSDRHKANSCEELGVWIKVGDICFIDYGKSYLNEAGFQHFGIIMKIKNNKALVIPMTSNEKTYKEALRANGKNHLMPIGKVEGMAKNSVLFLNDARFINTARIIDVKAHVHIQSELFINIQKRFHKTIL